ncbi:hypothetical protein H4582DRAFT_2051981 [Lactarius indigo]|nr:hypothetical protein H4582DRAFT_2051981 [Lactarius indigo]
MSPDGYDIGRSDDGASSESSDKFVKDAFRVFRYQGIKYQTVALNITGLLPPGSTGINHGITPPYPCDVIIYYYSIIVVAIVIGNPRVFRFFGPHDRSRVTDQSQQNEAVFKKRVSPWEVPPRRIDDSATSDTPIVCWNRGTTAITDDDLGLIPAQLLPCQSLRAALVFLSSLCETLIPIEPGEGLKNRARTRLRAMAKSDPVISKLDGRREDRTCGQARELKKKAIE